LRLLFDERSPQFLGFLGLPGVEQRFYQRQGELGTERLKLVGLPELGQRFLELLLTQEVVTQEPVPVGR
jgi:hypothetical protein